MATIKAVLRKKPNKDGLYPIAIRITKDRKPVYLYTGYSIKLEEWDSGAEKVTRSHPSSSRLNNFILSKKAEASNKALEAETKDSRIRVEAIKRNIRPKSEGTFFARAKEYLKNLKAIGRYNSYVAEKPRIKHFKEFLNGNDISFSDITVGLLHRYEVYLESTRSIGKRTVVNHLLVIRTIFNKAIEEGLGNKDNYPFGKGKISIKFPGSTKVGGSIYDVEKLENVQLENLQHDHARNLWLISFYFAGMRISDVLRLRWSDFKDERLHYKMGKNNKTGSIIIVEKAFKILDKYQDKKEGAGDLVFPDLKSLPDLTDQFEVQRRISFSVNRYDKMLKKYVAPAAGIDLKLTMHIARHTFATIAGDKIPLPMLQKLYRHSDIKTTLGYQSNFANMDTDAALFSVLNVEYIR